MKGKILKSTAAVIMAALLASAPVAAESVTIFDSDSKSLQLDGIVPVSDYQGCAAALLEFTFTNKTADAKAPMYEYFPTVYQDGVSLASTTILDANYSALCNSSLTQVKDGASVSYAMAYRLNDLTTDLDIEIADALAGGNVQSFTIPVTNGEQDNKESETEVVNWVEKYNELLKEYKELKAAYDALLAEKETETE